MSSKRLKTTTIEKVMTASTDSMSGLDDELAIDCNDCDWVSSDGKQLQTFINCNQNQRPNDTKQWFTSDKSTNTETMGLQLHYKPKASLRCLCRGYDPSDSSTSIWSVNFKPKTGNGNDGNRFVTTCASNMVCVIDCQKTAFPAVVNRYIDSNEDEEFMTCVWSVIPMDSEIGSESQTPVLAVGGKRDILLFVDINELECSKRVKAAHLDQINALVFIGTDLLFSASYDKCIKLWQISRPNETIECQMLRMIDTNNHFLSLSYSNEYNILIASGWSGLSFWSNPTQTNGVLAEMKAGLVDGLQIIPEDQHSIAIRIHLSKDISIIDLKKIFHLMHKSDKSSKVKSISLDKVLKGRLESFDTDMPFIYLSAQKNLLVSGGPNGQIWLYNTDRFEEYYRKKEMGRPDQIIDWPLIQKTKIENKVIFDNNRAVNVNICAISPDLKYLCAVTDINIVCIYHRI